jgi:hypothetical protein
MAAHTTPTVFNGKETIPKRETVSHDTVKVKKSTWSDWKCVIAPIKLNGWFARPDGKRATIRSVDLDILPTHKIGVYEIGISPSFDQEEVVCVYVGRAKSEKTGLRTRLSGYIRDGSDFHIELRYYLDLGCHVHIRWAFLSTLKECVTQEKKLLSCYNYVCNTANNFPLRDTCHTLWETAVTGRYALLLVLIKKKTKVTAREQLLELVRTDSTEDECSEMLKKEKKRREAVSKKK